MVSSEPLHAGCPWREVVHIDMQRGPRGGERWRLTLECGHKVSRPIAPLNLADLIPPAVAMSSRFRSRKRTAPERVRCVFCGSR